MLKVKSENWLFLLLLQLVKEEPNRKILFSKIKYEYIQVELLQHFIPGLHSDDIDSELFNSFKGRLLCEVTPHQKSISNRWENQNQKFQTDDISKILSSDLEMTFELLKHSNPHFPIIKEDGIIKYIFPNYTIQLGKEKINFTSSSIYGHEPVYIFSSDSNYAWLSNNYQNSWIMIQFKTLKISLVGYKIDSNHDWKDSFGIPKSWKVEGSNDNTQWFSIDSRSNESSLLQSPFKSTFPVEKSEFYSHFKFTQTDVNSGRNFHFLIQYLEFYGDILE